MKTVLYFLMTLFTCVVWCLFLFGRQEPVLAGFLTALFAFCGGYHAAVRERLSS